MKWLIYHLYLKPLIIEDKRDRFFGTKPDEWFWADELALEWGYICDWNADDDDYAALSPYRRLEMLKALRDEGLEMIERRELK